MSNVRIEWNLQAFKDIRSAPGVIDDLEARGKAVFDACGGEAEGYGMESHRGAENPQGRHRVTVFTDTPRAMVKNARDNTLVRKFGAAGG